MVDYAEGYLNLKNLVNDLWGALVAGDHKLARTICDCIVVEARLTKAQIGAQDDGAQ